MTTETSGLQLPSRELRILVNGFLSDALSRSEFARLEELLEGNSDARDYYLRVSSIESLIPVALAESEAPLAPSSQRKGGFKKPLITALAAGLVVILGLGFYAVVGGGGGLRSKDALSGVPNLEKMHVTLIDLVGVRWAEGSQASEQGDAITGSLEIDSGVLEMTYQNGVRIILEGPASYTVTGANSGRLDFGTVVADVPPAGHGFELKYGDDTLVDFGTQFGVRLLKHDNQPEVAVFEGEVEVKNSKGNASRLVGGHAVRKISDELESIPIDRSRYVRELPSREFPWEMPSVMQGDYVTFEFDATELIRRSGKYLCIFKWMHGSNRLLIDRVELRRDGVLVSKDDHHGVTGLAKNTVDNTYTVVVGDGDDLSGKWTLNALVHCALPDCGELRPVETMGILLVQEVFADPPVRAKYLGEWRYWHDGLEWKRTFREDGKMELYRNGQFLALGDWSYRDGFVSVLFPVTGVTETVLADGLNTLIFLNQPYLNAVRFSE